MVSEGVDVNKEFDYFELVKAIYRLKQALRVWNNTFHAFVCSIEFQVFDCDPRLYFESVNGECVLLLVYVDDVLVTLSTQKLKDRKV